MDAQVLASPQKPQPVVVPGTLAEMTPLPTPPPPAPSAPSASSTFPAPLHSTASESQLNLSTPKRNKAVYPSRRYEKKSTWLQCIFGALYLLMIVVCAFLDVVYFLFPIDYIIRPIFGRGIYKRVYKFFEGLVFAMLAGLLEFVAGVKIVVTMDPGDESLEPQNNPFGFSDQILMICNHRTEVDWLFFWNLALRYGCHDRIRIMMKAIIRYAPGVGWALLQMNFPFVNRRWATDEERIRKVVKSYRKYEAGTWLSMFPEGTILEKRTLEKSHEFSMERGEPQWNYVLYPRVRGFELCVEEFDPESILDVTIGYPELADGILPSPVRFLFYEYANQTISFPTSAYFYMGVYSFQLRCIRGQYPKEVHIHLKRYRKASFEASKGDMSQWCVHIPCGILRILRTR